MWQFSKGICQYLIFGLERVCVPISMDEGVVEGEGRVYRVNGEVCV